MSGSSCGLPGCGKAGPSNRLCSACRGIYYCSKDHQKQHWGRHKTVCRATTAKAREEEAMLPAGRNCTESLKPHRPTGTQTYRPANLQALRPAVPDMDQLSNLMMMMAGVSGLTSKRDLPSIHEEYRAKYPRDSKGFGILRQEYSRQIMSSIAGDIMATSGDSSVLSSFGNIQKLLSKRWRHFSPDLLSFLWDQEGKFGEVWRDHPELTAETNCNTDGAVQLYQTMRNTCSQDTVLLKGRSYVSIGFVDLQQLMEAEVVGQGEDGPVVWRGFDRSPIVVARAKLILALLQQADVSVEQVLQIWYSSCITFEAATALQKTCQRLASKESNKEQAELLLFWSSATECPEKAAVIWSQDLDSANLVRISRLAEGRDRVFYSRYLLTGHLFLPEGSRLAGNPTFFCLPQGYSNYQKTKVENIFYTIQVESLDYKLSLKATLEERFTRLLDKFKGTISRGDIKISMEVETMSPGMNRVISEIQKLNPAQVDWSNVPDYLAVKDFFQMAKQCSGEATRHTFHSMNWYSRVFGCNLMDYVPYSENYHSAGFSLTSNFKDRRGVLDKLVKNLTQELKATLNAAVVPSFIHQDLDTVGAMDVSEEVLGRRYLDSYITFMFEEQRLSEKQWRVWPFSFFSRANATCEVSFTFEN